MTINGNYPVGNSHFIIMNHTFSYKNPVSKESYLFFFAIRKWNKYSRLLHFKKKLPKSYNVIPTTLLVRLAVDKIFKVRIRKNMIS